jgi:hypothetical protein
LKPKLFDFIVVVVADGISSTTKTTIKTTTTTPRRSTGMRLGTVEIASYSPAPAPTYL